MPETHDPIAVLILERYVAGEATRAERLAVERWAAADLENRARLEDLRLVWELGASELPSVDTDRALSRTKRRATARSLARRRAAAYPARRVWYRAVSVLGMALAASAVVLVVRSGIIGPGRNTSGAGGLVYAAAAGQREKTTLPDGTQFTLGPASRLRLAADYSHGSRDVYLDGEAYFQVRHDAAQPFTVQAGGVIARDIGTQFDVRAYGNDAAVRVAVAEGMVGIAPSRGSGQTTLRAGDVALVADTALAVTHGADVAALTGWTHGELSFHDAPLSVVVADLSRWYAVDIRIADARLARFPVTATVDEESLTQALDLLTPTVGARYAEKGSTVTLYPAAHFTPLPTAP